MTRRFFRLSMSGRSFLTTTPSSWSTNPGIVTVQLISVTLMHTSGR